MRERIDDLSELLGEGTEWAWDRDRIPVEMGAHNELAKTVLRMAREGSNAPIIHTQGDFWRYNNESAVWEVLDKSVIETWVSRAPRYAIWQNAATGARFPIQMTKSILGSVAALCEVVCKVPDFFDAAPPGIALRDGWLDTDSLQLQAHSPRNRSRHTMDVSWSGETSCPRFHSFLRSCWAGDQDCEQKVTLVGQFIGACLAGKAIEHQKALMLLGVGSNGKSILCDALYDLFPNGSVCSVSPHEMASEQHAARLAGAHLNMVSDIPARDLLDCGKLKQIIVGDQISAKVVYKPVFEFRPRCGHIFSANMLPKSNDTSSGFWRRWIILKFNRTFKPGQKGTIPKERLLAGIQEERSAIVAWALQEFRKMEREGNGFLIPTSSEEAVIDWRSTSDQLKLFADDRVTNLVAGTVENILKMDASGDMEPRLATASEVYEQYKAWAKTNGFKQMSKATFWARMDAMPEEQRIKRAVGNGGTITNAQLRRMSRGGRMLG